MIRTVRLCQFLKDCKKVYQDEVNKLLLAGGRFSSSANNYPYVGGVPEDELVDYVYEKERKNLEEKSVRKMKGLKKLLRSHDKENKTKICDEIESRMPRFIREKKDFGGIAIHPITKDIILSSSVLDLTDDGNKIVDDGLMKYLHRFRFWSQEWSSPINLAITFGAGVLIGGIYNWLIVPMVHWLITL